MTGRHVAEPTEETTWRELAFKRAHDLNLMVVKQRGRHSA